MECIIHTSDNSEDNFEINRTSNNASKIHAKKLIKHNPKFPIYAHRNEKSYTIEAKNIDINSEKVYPNDFHNSLVASTDKKETLERTISRKLFDVKSLAKIAVWYFFSFLALFLSKHVIDFHSVDLLLFS